MCLEENILNGNSSKISAAGKVLAALQCLDMNSVTHVMACKINYKSNKQGSVLVKILFVLLSREGVNNFLFISKCQQKAVSEVPHCNRCKQFIQKLTDSQDKT